jgi:hypothetical protein
MTKHRPASFLTEMGDAERLGWLLGPARSPEARRLTGLSDDALRRRELRGEITRITLGPRARGFPRWQLLGLPDPLGREALAPKRLPELLCDRRTDAAERPQLESVRTLTSLPAANEGRPALGAEPSFSHVDMTAREFTCALQTYLTFKMQPAPLKP